MTRWLCASVFVGSLLLGCRSRDEAPPAAGEAPPSASVQALAASSGPAAAGECSAQASEAEGTCGVSAAAGCGCEHSGPIQNNELSTRTDPATGKTLQAVGRKLAGLVNVKVSELIAHPDRYAGKYVRVEGDVAAMCTHRRAWFSVQDEGDRSGAYVRVIAAPAFLVPEQAVGKKARAEGTVELVDVPGATAQHLSNQHGLDGTQVGKAVIIRASGA